MPDRLPLPAIGETCCNEQEALTLNVPILCGVIDNVVAERLADKYFD